MIQQHVVQARHAAAWRLRGRPLAAWLLAAWLLSGCASFGGDGLDIPPGAVATSRTEANGDEITEFRVAGQLRTVRVVPARGPTYYLIDSNGDGRLDTSRGEVSPVYYKLFDWN